jgi:hypothetical protein
MAEASPTDTVTCPSFHPAACRTFDLAGAELNWSFDQLTSMRSQISCSHCCRRRSLRHGHVQRGGTRPTAIVSIGTSREITPGGANLGATLSVHVVEIIENLVRNLLDRMLERFSAEDRWIWQVSPPALKKMISVAVPSTGKNLST